jgi:tRNA (cytidine32/uridine32-2'-O)-methyltransferase
MLSHIRIVLVAPSHPGNIGAVARAMKTMSLTRLYLVNPKVFPHVDATARAAGADDLLANAVVVNSLAEGITDCQLVVGTSARIRALPIEVLSPKEAAAKISYEASASQVAIVFGRENNGLNNEELALCNFHIYIPADPDFNSLNLASAVQIIAYEIKMAQENKGALITNDLADELANNSDMELFYTTLMQLLIELEFLNPQNPRKLMVRLKRLFNRARVEKLEFNVLMGILTAIKRKMEICET